MQTKQTVKMALLVLGVLAFSGCTPKTVYISQRCQVAEPIEDATQLSCNSLFPDDDNKYGDCVAEKLILIQSDLKKYKIAFRGCK